MYCCSIVLPSQENRALTGQAFYDAHNYKVVAHCSVFLLHFVDLKVVGLGYLSQAVSLTPTPH